MQGVEVGGDHVGVGLRLLLGLPLFQHADRLEDHLGVLEQVAPNRRAEGRFVREDEARRGFGDGLGGGGGHDGFRFGLSAAERGRPCDGEQCDGAQQAAVFQGGLDHGSQVSVVTSWVGPLVAERRRPA